MVNIIVMTHGEFCDGICKSVEMLVGAQENIRSLALCPGESLDNLVEHLKVTIDSFKNDFPCVVLVDLFGGSPSNAVAMLLGEGYKIYSLAGVNIPMILEVINSREECTLDDLLSQAESAGVEGITNVVTMFNEA